MIKKLFVILGILLLVGIVVATPDQNQTCVYWNPMASSSPALTRVNSDNSTMTSAPSFSSQFPWNQIGRVNTSQTQYQTMVYMPLFYYKTTYSSGAFTFCIWNQSDSSLAAAAGYVAHPAFQINNTIVPYKYMSAFEADQYNATYGYRNDTAKTSSTTYPLNTAQDVLTSVPGVKPVSGQNITLSLTNSRTLAENRGTGWELQTFGGVSAVQLLMTVEYANLNAQSYLSAGITQITDDGKTNMGVPTGYTAGIGTNASSCGNTTCQAVITHYQTGQTTYPFSWRGIENFYGDMYKWVDGINIQGDHKPWVANYGFASNKFSAPYVNTTLILPASNGYVSNITQNPGIWDYTFLPSAVGGSSTSYLCDYYYQTTGNMAALLGSYWNSGTYAGPFHWDLSTAASISWRYIGARLGYTPPVYASFTQSVSGSTTSLTDTSFTISTVTGVQGTPNVWNWSFGDGTFSNSQNPTHIYAANGTYTVTENASVSGGAAGAFSLSSQNVSITIPPTASYMASPASPQNTPVTVTFTDTSINYPTAWSWYINDVLTNSTQNISYTFSTPGTYWINMTDSNAGGSGGWYNWSYLVNPPPPVVSYSASPVSGTANAPVTTTFTDTSTNSPTGYIWQINGTAATTLSTATYTISGTVAATYWVNHTASNAGGTGTWDNATYSVLPAIPNVSYSASPPSPQIVPVSVMFTDTSANLPTAYIWQINGGAVTTLSTATTIFNTPGTEWINHTASNSGGSGGWVNQTYIVNPMVATASGTPVMGGQPLTVNFAGSSTGTPDAWYWIFGDGGTSSQQNPVYTYNNLGTYEVDFQATNISSGQYSWDNLTNYISVLPYPITAFTGSPLSGTSPLTVSFTDQTQYSPNQWNWSFGDGVFSTLQNPVHSYTVGSTMQQFTVILNATNAVGSSILTKTNYVTVYPTPPTASFTSFPTSPNTPYTLSFNDTSQSNAPLVSWYWNFGDGATSSAENVTHTYTTSGTYDIHFEVTNSYGYSSWSNQTAYVNAGYATQTPTPTPTPTPAPGYYIVYIWERTA